MRTKKTNSFTSIRVEGHILPADLIQRISSGDSSLGGLTPDSFHLPSEKINEATTQAWNRLQASWASFRSAAGKLNENETGTTVTRERWLLPLFQELGYGRLPSAKAVEIEGKTFPVSHRWGDIPIHLVGFNVALDKVTAGVAGAAKSSPHSFVQELLNRSEESLWGFVSNGLRLRILRDNINFVRQSFVEFDLESMMEGEAYSDFVLLWLLCHQSRVEGERKEDYWLEKWSKTAQEQGIRALDSLREGVEAAITALGKGFLAHRANIELKQKLRSGELDKQDYYRQILRLVYRLLFLFVAEDRELLLDPSSPDIARERFTKYYSTARMRRLAERRFGSRHEDLFIGLRLVMEKLGNDDGCSQLGLPALGSFLFSQDALADIYNASIANHDLLDAIRALAFVEDKGVKRQVDYKNLGSEELGSIYESLLELNPEMNIAAATFDLKTLSGNERKTSGSYYTPTSLINALLDSALDPVIIEAAKKPNPEKAILDLKICDPACGSGHFLVAASHRLAKRLAAVRTGAEEPSPEDVRHALRDVVGRCIYGVDINPMSVELCKVSLWMEALEPGKPLSFLDHHIRVGNSLLGTTPALLKQGIPDEAFKPIEGDDRELCAEYKKQNKRENQQDLLLGFGDEPWENLGDLASAMVNLEEISDDTIEGIRKRQERYESLVNSSGYLFGGLFADAWCAAFVWKKNRESGFPYAVTEEEFRKIRKSPYSVSPWMRDEIIRLSKQYKFFHWHLAFPDVFRVPIENEKPENSQTGWSGGFDCILGNPPWERIKIQEIEWFGQRNPEIAAAANSATRKRLIEQLKNHNISLYKAFQDDLRQAEGESHLIRNSSRYPLCGRGDVNTYSIFAETARGITNSLGRVGIIVPSGIATDDTTKYFFQDLMHSRSLVSLYSFENEEFIFPSIHHATKFCLLTMCSTKKSPDEAGFVFFARQVDDLNVKERHFTLSLRDVELINPNTGTAATFKNKRDAEITKFTYKNVPPLILDNPITNNWKITFFTMFHMSGDSELFRNYEYVKVNKFDEDILDDFLPLYEGKMIHQFDHRFGTYEGQTQAQANQGKLPELNEQQHSDPNLLALPRYWIERQNVTGRLAGKWQHKWLIGWRDITSSVTARTLIASVIPLAAIGHTLPLLLADVSPAENAILIGNLNSFIVDYITRQKIGGTHLTYFILKQIPILPLEIYKEQLSSFIIPRILELTYTARDLKSFALDLGYEGNAFIWDESRRFEIRCELDALYFHLYGVPRDDVSYIMETFPIVKRKDETNFGEYRTKRVILEIYDEMISSGIFSLKNYQPRLSPPPADSLVTHQFSKQSYKLVLPLEKRYSVENNRIYLMLVIFTALHETENSIRTEQLINICKLLAMPDRLEQNGKIIDSEISHKWRSQYCDTLQPNLFMLTLRDLVDRGHIKLIPDNESSRIVLVDAPDYQVSPHIQFDVHFALSVSEQLAFTELEELPEIATDSEIRSLYAA